MTPPRDRQAIRCQFDMSEEEFEALYSAYDETLRVFHGSRGDWNAEIDELARQTSALTEEEIRLARTDLSRAVLNRIILNRVMAGVGRSTTPAPAEKPRPANVAPVQRLPMRLWSTILRSGHTSTFRYELHADCKVLSLSMTYHFLFYGYALDGNTPVVLISSESSGTGPFLCVTTGEGRSNLGRSDDWLDADRFLEASLQVASERLG